MDEMLAPRGELPAAVRDFIIELTSENRAPAYLLVDERMNVADLGGELGEYGLAELRRGGEVDEQLPLLAGLLPLDAGNVFLPKVKMDAGPYADVYLFGGEQGTWVLLLNATAEAVKRQHMQQRTYDLSLQVTDLQREGDELHQAKSELERRVAERTAELARANQQLLEALARSRRAEAQLRESEARFRRIADSNMMGIMFWRMGERITDANKAFLDTLGYTLDDLESGELRWEKLSGDANRAADERAFAQLAEHCACAPYERQFVRKDGRPVTLLFGAALLLGSQSEIVCFTIDLSKCK